MPRGKLALLALCALGLGPALAACPPSTAPAAGGTSACAAPVPSALLISAPQTWAQGAYTFDQLTIAAAVTISGVVNLTATSLTLTPAGSIVGDGGGFGSDAGPCWAPPAAGALYAGTGAAHGGCPSRLCPGPMYAVAGDALAPALPGSGGRAPTFSGSCPRGGAGGAALRLTAATLQLSGLISVNGAAGGNGGLGCDEAAGGGAGGSVLVRAGLLLASTGSIRANGGDGGANRQGSTNNAPPGGGGRIAFFCDSAAAPAPPAALASWPVALSARGGSWAGSLPSATNVGWPGGSMGGAGTLYADCGGARAALLLAGDPATFRAPMANSTLLLAGGAAVALGSLTFASSGSLAVAVPPGAPPAALCVDALLGASDALAQRLVAGPNVSLQVGGCACPRGSFSATGGGLPCYAACPAGFECAGTLAAPCPRGTAAAAGAGACAPCSAGRFSAAPAAPQCAPCPAGVYGAAPGLASPACSANCTASPGYGCPAGSSAPAAQLCAAGFYCPGGSPAPALPCAPGSFSAAGAAACALCPAGSFCAGGGALRVPCSPEAACGVAGLSAQPPCYWSVSTLAGSAAAGFSEGLGAAAAFSYPLGLATSADGAQLYVADSSNHRLRAVSLGSGAVSTLAGSGAAAWADGVGAAAALHGPYAVALDATTGTLVVADQNNNRIRRVTPVGAVTTICGSGAAGSADGAGAAASFYFPEALAVDANGTIFVADALNNRVRAVTPQGVVSTLASGLSLPRGVAVDGLGTVYVSDSNSGSIKAIAREGAVSTLASGLNFPGHIALASAAGGGALLVVADQNNNLIRAVSPLGAVTTLAGSGAPGAVNGFGRSAGFSKVFGVAVAQSGELFAGGD